MANLALKLLSVIYVIFQEVWQCITVIAIDLVFCLKAKHLQVDCSETLCSIIFFLNFLTTQLHSLNQIFSGLNQFFKLKISFDQTLNTAQVFRHNLPISSTPFPKTINTF